jgi:Bifunctional DNA primase/polymerase, N-terminal
MSALVDAALDYAARGLPVYPAHWPRPGSGGASLACSCQRGRGCDRPAKHPLTRHGVKDATINPERIRAWWRRWPHANVGVATGVTCDVLDVDGAAGLAALRHLARTVNLTLPGPVVRTGGRGWHYWFHPTGLGCRPPHDLDCVDWRGRGGAVLAPPSRHASGGTYHWLVPLTDRPLPEVPGPLRALLNPPAPPRRQPTRPPGRSRSATPTAAGCSPTNSPASATPSPGRGTAP